ncbi:phosphatidylglycerophosphatase A [Glaesserella sp.]|uniref:phosphatidylglycerophosphatase A family protein n=1 Tax=Glaesserella sp. TaxID=2094731 RepID=UPI00359FEE17
MNINLKKPTHCLAFGFGSGLITPAPGTWGSLVGLVISILLSFITTSPLFFLLLTFVAFIGGCYICQAVSQDLNVHDDGRIVWDEIVAVFLIFTFLPAHNWLNYLLTFIIFRFFDITKPYPIRYFDQHLHGGLGIMFDDILAAIYTLITLHVIYWWF